MEFLTDLWLPILLSGVFVFVVSSILHMVLPLHRSDYGKLAAEDEVMEAIRKAGVTPGEYMFPRAESMKAACTPEMREKFDRGPVGLLTIMPNGMPNMGKGMLQWFLYCLLVGFLAAYLAWHALGAGAKYLAVFRTVGTAAMLAHVAGVLPASIWKGQRWSVTAKFVFDGVLYGLVTAGTFAWLWPRAALPL